MAGSSPVAMRRGAIFDRSRRYRYSLTREFGPGPRVLFILLNPSTADAARDDPTIRRCIGFARAHGFGSLEVVNLFALRTPSPRVLLKSQAPVGPRNNLYIREAAARASTIITGWGNHGAHRGRSRAVRAILARFPVVVCLGLTKMGEPRHPLYVARDHPLIPL